MKTSIVLGFILMGLSLRMNAQEITISGKVIDAFTGQALAKASIYTDHNQGCSAGADGSYSYRYKQGETLNITYSYAGYETLHRTLKLHQDTTINVALSPTTYKLNAVVVTGVQRQKLLQDSPSPVQIITQKEMATMGYSAVTDVLASFIPGIAIQEDNMGTSITIDGLSSKYVLVLIDGQRIAGETDGNIDFERLNTLNIERIEVIKGAGSLLYGSNAISGVVNIITKQAQQEGFQASLVGRYASFNTPSLGAVVHLKKDKWKASTDAQYRHTDGYEKATLISQEAYNDLNIHQKLSYTANTQWSFHGDMGYYRHQIKDEEASRTPLYTDFSERLQAHYEGHKANFLSIDHALDQYTTTQHVNLSGKDIMDYQNTLLTHRLTYTHSLKEKHSLQAGIEMINDYLYSDNVADSSKQQMSLSLFASDAYNYSDQFSLVASARLVYASTYGSTFVPGLSLMYKLKTFNLRGGYAMGYRSPTLKELYMDFDHLGWFTMVGNPDLEAELSQYTHLSAEYHKGRFTSSISFYHNYLNNKIQETSPFDSSLVSYYNVDKVRIWGSNIRFSARLSAHFKVSGGIALQDPRDLSSGKQLESTYKQSGNLRLDFSYPLGEGEIGSGLIGRFYSSTTLWDLDSDGELVYSDCSAYQMYNASVYYQSKKAWMLTAAVKNLFNYTDYVEKSTYSPGRSFSISLSYHFKQSNN